MKYGFFNINFTNLFPVVNNKSILIFLEILRIISKFHSRIFFVL